jgi:hypothetical protein
MVNNSQFHSRRYKNTTKISKTIFVLAGFLIFSIAFQTLMSGFSTQISSDPPTTPSSSARPIDDIPINEIKVEQKNGLGEIEITNARLYGNINESNFISPDTENVTYDHDAPLFSGTVRKATTDNADGSNIRVSHISIQINETVQWFYNESISIYDEFMVGFSPEKQPAILKEIYLNETIVSNSSKYYSNTAQDTITFMFDFKEEFQNNPKGNFVLLYVYEVHVPIIAWQIETPIKAVEIGDSIVSDDDFFQYMEDIEQDFTQNYEYNVTLGNSETPLNMTAQFAITFPNPDDIHSVVIDSIGNLDEDDYNVENTDNILTIKNYLDLYNSSSLDAHFRADFTVEMLEVVDGFWCEDRLVAGEDLRERDYKITITSGPADLMLKYFGFNDTTIFYPHLKDETNSIKSALGRLTTIYDMNTSSGISDGVIQSEDISQGISMLSAKEHQISPYVLFKDEIDIITVQYYAIQDLSFVITDNIQTPLSDIKVNIYFGGISYGSLINLDENYPMGPKISNSQGEITVYNVPVGNFTIEVLDFLGNPKENITVSSLNEMHNNLVITSNIHFPEVLLYFAGISAFFLLLGLVIYKKNG